MDIKKFLSSVLADNGFYCAVGIKSGSTPKQKFFKSKKELALFALDMDSDGYDVYAALATFVEQKRNSDNVSRLQCLYLDLDCGEGKPFASKRDALVKVREFCHKVDLPKPSVLVDSGRGVHVYWVFEESVDLATWLPMSTQLKKLCVKHQFEADPVVTADSARILRIPGTRNFKQDPPLQCSIMGHVGDRYPLSRFSKLMAEDLGVPAMVAARKMSSDDRQMMDHLLGNYTKKFSKILIKTAEGKGCAQIDRAVKNPAELSYAQWTDVLSVVKFCEEGPVAIHAISQGYPGYDAETTTKVADSLNAPHLCTTFEGNHPSGCANCPLKGKIKSPITIGMEVREATEQDNIVHVPLESVETEESPKESEDGLFEAPSKLSTPMQTYVIPKYPYPYFRGANGGIYLKKKNKDGEDEDVEVYHCDVYPVKRIRDPILGACTLIRYHTKLDGVKDFVVPSTKLLSKEEFKKEMGFHGILVINPDQLMFYFLAWTKQMENTSKEEEALTQFGWTKNLDAFVVGARRIKAKKIEENPPSAFTQPFFKAFEPKGTLDNWIKAADFLNRPGYEAHQYMLGLSFASPLMMLIPNINGGIYNLYSSDSGLGKSQAQFLGASVWGQYSELVIRGGDTDNMIWNRAEIMKNIVVYVEEVTNMPPDVASSFAYKSGEGKQKGRMSNFGQNRERYRGESWALQIGLSSNAKLSDKIAQKKAMPRGEMQRMLEVEAFKLLHEQEDVKLARQFNEAIQENYGHACVPFIQQLLKNMPAAKGLLHKVSDALVKAADLSVQNRIWIAQCATVLAGMMIAKKIGLISFDMDRLFTWVVERLKENKEIIKQTDMRVDDIVTNYIAENIRGVLRIRSGSDARFKDNANVDVLTAPDSTPMYKWVARHEFDTNKLILLVTPFKKWCVNQQMDYHEVIRGIEKDLNGQRDKVRIGRGTKFNLPSAAAIILHWDDEPLKKILNPSEVFDGKAV